MIRSIQLKDSEISDLIQKMAAGDQSALTALYDATSHFLFGLIVRMLGNHATAEEVLLDAYTQAWRQSAEYLPGQEPPMAWLLKIGRSRAIERLRAGKFDIQRQTSMETAQKETAKEGHQEEDGAISERQKMARSAIASLTPEQQKVIELAYFSGLSSGEIALKTGQPLGAIRTRSRLGMIHLEEQLRSLFEVQ
jgi:RNA polymerase sigma-70 factor, ECF subfamily